MSKSSMYRNYLATFEAEHGPTPAPVIINYFDPERQDFEEVFASATLDRNARANFLRPSTVFRLDDGRVVENGVDGRGCPVWAVFASAEEQSRPRPMSFNEYFEYV